MKQAEKKKHLTVEEIFGHELLAGGADLGDVKLVSLCVDMCVLKKKEASPRCRFDSYFAKMYDAEKNKDVVVERNWKKNKELWLIRVFEVTESGIEEVKPIKLEAAYLFGIYGHYTAIYALWKNRTYIVLERFVNDFEQEAFVLYRLVPGDDINWRDTLVEGKFVEKDKFVVDHIVIRPPVLGNGDYVDLYEQINKSEQVELDMKAMDRFEALVKHFIEVQVSEISDIYNVKSEEAVEMLSDEGMINAILLAHLVHLSLERRL